ncbi:glutathione S-transferase family protein [Roseibium sp.]|uniref:glutathione S-transferase family protein n=1 Tax=Roseibium sp. TaxID=1936156 RepID=UPI003BAF2FDA
MKPVLYQFSGAPRSWRVRLGLAFKGLDAEIRTLSVSDKDHHKPDFVALNPRSTVPVLVAGETRLRDSIAILAWLDRVHPLAPLFGETPDEAACIWQISMECADYLRAANHALLSQVFSSDGSVPPPESEDRKRLEAAAQLLHAECAYLEELLKDERLFLAGDRPTAADAIAFPEIRLVQRAVMTRNALMATVGFGFPPDRYPKTAEWKDRLNSMPEIAATMPEHWNEQTVAA